MIINILMKLLLSYFIAALMFEEKLVNFISLELHFSLILFVKKIFNFMSSCVVEAIVYSEIAKYSVLTCFYSDLSIAVNNVVLVVGHSSINHLVVGFLFVQSIALIVGH